MTNNTDNSNTDTTNTPHACGLSPKPVPGPMPLRETFDTNTPHECGLSAQAIAWVQEHGSAFLRFCVAEGIKCIRIYNEERLRQEAPGWQLLDEIVCPPSNPPAVMMDLVLRARERFPQARLWQIYRDDYDGEEYVEFVVVARSPWPDGRDLVSNYRIRTYKD